MNLKQAEGVTRSDLFYIDPSQIKAEEGFNVRINYGDMEELEQSIFNNGIKTPLTVRTDDNGNIFVTNGHRRLRAVMNIISKGQPFGKLPCIAEPKRYSEDERTADLLRTNDGLPLSMLEQGLAMKRLRDIFQMSNRQISEKVGKREAHVSNCLILSDSDARIQRMIEKGSVAETTVLEVLRKESDPKMQVEILKESVETAKESGKSRATGQDVLGKMIEKGTVKKAPSAKSLLQSLYEDSYAENSNKMAHKALGMVVSFLNKEEEVGTIEELKEKLGLV